MEFSLIGGLVTGIVATAVMSVMMKMAARSGMTDMPPMELVTGSMMASDKDRAMTIGVVIHWLMMGTIVFGLGYAAIFTALGSASVITGVLLGAAHGLVVGLVFMPLMPAMHPRMVTSAGLEDTVTVAASGVQLSAPGVFGSRWGGMTPVGLMMGHVVFGLVAALVYQAFV